MRRIGIFTGLIMFILTDFLIAQDMLVSRNNQSAVPRTGESEIIIDNSEGSRDYPLAVYINGEIRAHIAGQASGSVEKIIVKDGSNVVSMELTQYDKKNGKWDEPRNALGIKIAGTKDRIVCNSQSNSITLKVKSNIIVLLSVKLDSTRPLSTTPSNRSTPYAGLDTALQKVGKSLTEALPERSTIAIMNIESEDGDITNFAIEELEDILVGTGYFRLVDRRSLDVIRQEQNFQVSGEVDDKSIISAGKKAGASVVITGSIYESDSRRRLRVRALDVKTGEVLATESERF